MADDQFRIANESHQARRPLALQLEATRFHQIAEICVKESFLAVLTDDHTTDLDRLISFSPLASSFSVAHADTIPPQKTFLYSSRQTFPRSVSHKQKLNSEYLFLGCV